jgi:hypothetical protein
MGESFNFNEEKLRDISKFLHLFKSLNITDRKKLLSNLSDREVDFISEVIKNFLKRNIRARPSIVLKLKKFKREIRNLSSREYSRNIKRKILNSIKGISILNLLLPFAIQKIVNILTV